MDVGLRNELKNWEKHFHTEYNRKPGKEDIKNFPEIALKYKAYGKIKKAGGFEGREKQERQEKQEQKEQQEQITSTTTSTSTSTPKKKTPAVFKTPTKSVTPKKLDHSQASPMTFKQRLNTISPNKNTLSTQTAGWTPRTKARKRLRGENVPNTPKKQRGKMLKIEEAEEDDGNTHETNEQVGQIEKDEDEDEDMMNTPAKKAFKPLFESPRPSSSNVRGSSNSNGNSNGNNKAVVLPPLPANTISTYIDNPQTQELFSSQSTIAQSQPSLSQSQALQGLQSSQPSQRGQKRAKSPDNQSKATISKKKSKTTFKYPNKITLPQSQKLADRQDIHHEPTQIELESTGQQISIIPHMHMQKRKNKKAEELSDDETDMEDYIEDYIPMNQRQLSRESHSPDNHNETVKSKLGDMSLDSPGAIKRSKEYNKQIDDKVRSLLSRSNDDDGFGSYRTEIKPLEEEESEGEDEDWEDDCDGWKADGIGYIEDYDYDDV
ncbi:hypothetical protein E3P91_01015 [Wallemia ichthyophaga]|nr:hypothetical protein E3P91_01015 [Wallemia ichthyophaga]